MHCTPAKLARRVGFQAGGTRCIQEVAFIICNLSHLVPRTTRSHFLKFSVNDQSRKNWLLKQ